MRTLFMNRKKMWRLKIEEGGNNPYLYSIAEERDEVEKLVLISTAISTMFNPVLISSGKCREKKMQQTIPQPKIEDGEEVTYEVTTVAVRRSVHLFLALQSKHGYWLAENFSPMFCFPPSVMSLYITGHLNTIFSPEHRKEIRRYIYYHQ
ncbi:hypothetical protein Goshw_001977, partial [Gossypium schwendimanii]|nr:hypothetical protein [Gossypium schwendimanii]